MSLGGVDGRQGNLELPQPCLRCGSREIVYAVQKDSYGGPETMNKNINYVFTSFPPVFSPPRGFSPLRARAFPSPAPWPPSGPPPTLVGTVGDPDPKFFIVRFQI